MNEWLASCRAHRCRSCGGPGCTSSGSRRATPAGRRRAAAAGRARAGARRVAAGAAPAARRLLHEGLDAPHPDHGQTRKRDVPVAGVAGGPHAAQRHHQQRTDDPGEHHVHRRGVAAGPLREPRDQPGDAVPGRDGAPAQARVLRRRQWQDAGVVGAAAAAGGGLVRAAAHPGRQGAAHVGEAVRPAFAALANSCRRRWRSHAGGELVGAAVAAYDELPDGYDFSGMQLQDVWQTVVEPAVLTLDFKSLYPSIMLSHLLCTANLLQLDEPLNPAEESAGRYREHCRKRAAADPPPPPPEIFGSPKTSTLEKLRADIALQQQTLAMFDEMDHGDGIESVATLAAVEDTRRELRGSRPSWRGASCRAGPEPGRSRSWSRSRSRRASTWRRRSCARWRRAWFGRAGRGGLHHGVHRGHRQQGRVREAAVPQVHQARRRHPAGDAAVAARRPGRVQKEDEPGEGGAGLAAPGAGRGGRAEDDGAADDGRINEALDALRTR